MWVPITAEEKVIWLTEVSNELRMELRVKRGDDDPKVSKRRSGTGQSGSYACILDLPYAGTRTPRPTNPAFRSRSPGRVPSWTSGQVRGTVVRVKYLGVQQLPMIVLRTPCPSQYYMSLVDSQCPRLAPEALDESSDDELLAKCCCTNNECRDGRPM